MLAKGVEIYVALAAPRTIIDGGTEQERRHIAMFAHKDRVYIVEELSLFLTARTFTRDIVEEDSKRADAKTIHLLKFVHKIVAIFIRPFDIESRVDCPIEVYPTLVRTDIEFLEQFCFILRICLAPMLTVIRIIFRTIDVDIHLVATIEINLTQAVFVTPRTTIETFDGAAEFHIGPVLDGASLELSFGNHVAQGLHTIIKSALIATGYDNTLRTHRHVVAFLLLRYEFLKLVDATIAHNTEGDAEVARFGKLFYANLSKCRDGIRRLSLTVGSNRPRFGSGKKMTSRSDTVWHRIHQFHLSFCPHGNTRTYRERE